MLSINTNLSSLIAQNSMQTSTNKLNQAIERMTTGFKINHAKDNAANYSISTNMTTKIGAYQVAEENTAMGMDMVQTASENLDQMQNHATRLRALATQARNGTYGAQSLEAIQAEANAITKEIERLYNTAQYNGVKLFSRKEYEIAPHLPQAGKSGFIDETALGGASVTAKAEYNGFIENPVTYTDARLAEMLASGDLVVLETDLESFTSGKSYLIKDKAQLEHLAELVNRGKDSTGAIFILGADIDLEGEEWTPIGKNSSDSFKGIFDGNGHVIKNLKVDKPDTYQGLFGYISSNSEIKNVGIKNANIKGSKYSAGLVGRAVSSKISNCFAEGKIEATKLVGGLVGAVEACLLKTSYTLGEISVTDSMAGGLVGQMTTTSSNIESCFSNVDMTGSGEYIGGLVGISSSSSNIKNSYATGDVNITNGTLVGGLVGYLYNEISVSNCYATGNVKGNDCVGGLVGDSYNKSIIENSYATGNVVGETKVGGLVGYLFNASSINNSFATGNVIGKESVGGLVGYCYANANYVTNSYSTSCVYGEKFVGGIVGDISQSGSTGTFCDDTFYGSVKGQLGVGEFAGAIRKGSSVLINNIEVLKKENDFIGGVYADKSLNEISNSTAEMTPWLVGIKIAETVDNSTILQVGIKSDTTSSLKFNPNFRVNLLELSSGIEKEETLSCIDDFINLLSEKQTELGSVSNRLDSALDEISIQYENLVSSRSTIRDVDMAEVSSQYIQQQILQEASATLLATTKNIQYQNVLGLLQGLRG